MTKHTTNFHIYCTIKKNVRLCRGNTDLKTNSIHKKLNCVFYFVMIFYDYKVHIHCSTERQIDNMPSHRNYVKGSISWTCVLQVNSIFF